MADKASRTEQPTAKKLSDARKKGNVGRSKELSGALSLVAFLIFGHVFGGEWMARLLALFGGLIREAHQPELGAGDAIVLLARIGSETGALLAMPLGFMVVAVVGGNVMQGPPPFTLQPLKPDFSKINPFKGIKKIIKLKSLIETLKTVAKMAMFSAIAWSAIREALIEGLPGGGGAPGALLALMTLGGKVIFRVAMLALALAALDWLFTRYDHTRNLKMTKQEIKDERKQSEGDPLVKARVRSKQMSLARSRMMTDVAKATVVITNPTHYAVALRFVPGETDLPQVLAKGRGKLAERIRAIAGEKKIPIISDPPLARALYRLVQVGGVIPERLYRAVAEVLALVLRGRPRGEAR